MIRRQTFETPVPSARDAKLAEDALLVLSPHADKTDVVDVAVGGEIASLPQAAVDILLEALGQLAAGLPVTLITRDAELTTQQAADYLSVSRPFLIRALERGEIPFRTVGRHRRVLLRDAQDYRKRLEGWRTIWPNEF